MGPLRVLMLGDVIGRPGRRVCQEHLPAWRESLRLDLVTANGENASGGNGLTLKNAQELFGCGIDVITSGNHIWKQKDYPDLFSRFERVLRPANYPDEVPGRGWIVLDVGSTRVGVVNLQGQVFMDPIDSPFRAAERACESIRETTQVILVDFHAEATSERGAMGFLLDGRVSAVVGTHTHVPSSDARILPKGTAYQTDLGMVGPQDSVLGVDGEAILRRFMTGLPVRFEVAKGPVICCGALLTIDPSNGRALSIERFEQLVE